jgi:hypothetical protein
MTIQAWKAEKSRLKKGGMPGIINGIQGFWMGFF